MPTFYHRKYGFCDLQIDSPPHPNTNLIVVIPCFNEPDLPRSLQALFDCQRPESFVEVIVVINASENSSEEILVQNKKSFAEAVDWIQEHADERMKIHLILKNDLPVKHAGVGLARKIGMDEAAARFDSIARPEGIIICFDADAVCAENYLLEVEKHFKENLQRPGSSIYFEHPLKTEEFAPEIIEGIINYELFLRYYKRGLQFAGHPFAFHTIGSSMAVRSSVYQKQGGMNKRKAGEDFYFIQKVIPLGNYSELTTTKVIPSPRPSDRVPFGTGKAINNWISENHKELMTYHPKIFSDLRLFCLNTERMYDSDISEILSPFPKSISSFLNQQDFHSRLDEIKRNSSGREAFNKRFYNWFNGFMALKYVHFARDHYHGEMEVGEAAANLLAMTNKQPLDNFDNKTLLAVYRNLDKLSK